MNAAWGGISDDKEISICVSENHKTTENILKKGAFTVSMADVEHMTACDYVGIVSGNKEPDKFVKAGFTAEKSEKVDAPIIKELPICIECKLKSYDKDTCRLIGEIVNVSVDESVLDENGNVDVAKAAPITFDPFNNAYIRLGEKVGDAFKAGTVRLKNPVLIITLCYKREMFLQLRRCISHQNSTSYCLQHFQIIIIISECNSTGKRDFSKLTKIFYSFRFVYAASHDLQKRIGRSCNR